MSVSQTDQVRLDHAGLMSADIHALHAAFLALGFTLTPLAQQSGRLQADGPVVQWGTANRCAMLQQGYVELLGIIDPAAPDNALNRFIARHPGIHILALRIEDEEIELARLRRAGFEIAGPLLLERPVDSADPTGPQARFIRLPLPEAPEGRIQLIRHLTPDAIWQPRFMTHPNNATALEAVVMAVDAPAETAARLSRLAGRPVTPDPAGGFALLLDQGTVRITDAAGLATLLPGMTPPALPFIAGLVIRTSDQAAAIRALSATAAFPLRQTSLGWTTEAGGAAIAFV